MLVSTAATESDLHFSDSFDQQQVHILPHLHDTGQACICRKTLTWQLAHFDTNWNLAGGHC